mgnify:CR=1 FL=1
MKLLVINSGSSSVKFQIIEMPSETIICKGLVERIGLERSRITYTSEKRSLEKEEIIKIPYIGY